MIIPLRRDQITSRVKVGYTHPKINTRSVYTKSSSIHGRLQHPVIDFQRLTDYLATASILIVGT